MDRAAGDAAPGRQGSASGSGDAAPGRPLGLLLAWLRVGEVAMDKDVHTDAANLRRLSGPEEHEWRQELRNAFRLLPGADALLARERRPLHPGEDEPTVVP